ncbi:MAG: Nif3-like dinuclear metal center hexameric protein [Bacteroidales bacterium]
MKKLKDIVSILEEAAPPALQESYDNSGLQVGHPDMEITGVLIALDVTPEVLEEAVETGCNLVLSHHPVVFGGLKALTGKTLAERLVIRAVEAGLAIYSGHTNFDAVPGGVNGALAARLGLLDLKILAPAEGQLRKLVVFVPEAHVDAVRDAMFGAGAGHIGRYDECGFTLRGEGSFRAGDGAHPFVGETGTRHYEKEVRLETVVPAYRSGAVIRALTRAHPYEEVAWDLYPLENRFDGAGAGLLGRLPEPMEEHVFLDHVKSVTGIPVIRHSALLGRPVHTVALCGGAGSFLLSRARQAGAQAFLTGDLKYHQFFDADGKLLLADIGHYESEQFSRDMFYDLITKKIPKFAVRLSKHDTNPIKYHL